MNELFQCESWFASSSEGWCSVFCLTDAAGYSSYPVLVILASIIFQVEMKESVGKNGLTRGMGNFISRDAESTLYSFPQIQIVTCISSMNLGCVFKHLFIESNLHWTKIFVAPVWYANASKTSVSQPQPPPDVWPPSFRGLQPALAITESCRNWNPHIWTVPRLGKKENRTKYLTWIMTVLLTLSFALICELFNQHKNPSRYSLCETYSLTNYILLWSLTVSKFLSIFFFSNSASHWAVQESSNLVFLVYYQVC